MSNEIYNIIFNSDIAAGTTPNESFYFDWSRIPNQPYQVSFSFVSAIATLTNTTCANIYVDLGCCHNFMANSSTGNTSYNSMFLGVLYPTGTGASNCIGAVATDNVPTYLQNRPTNNNITIQIHQNLITQMTDYSPAPGRYTLILSFKAVS